MATLTWQDVAGQVRAPDYSEAASLITQGLGQVSAAAQTPERLRQEKLDQEMKGLMIQSEMNNRTGNMIDKIDTKLKNEVKERDLKEFSKNQSYLEANVRKAAMKGMSLDDFLANDPIYKNMGEGAKSYGAANLSDAYLRGDETRITMEERAKDDAYRAKRDAIADAQWRQNHALAAENARLAREERAALKAERDALKPKVWKTGSDKTDKAMSRLAAETGNRYIEASGARYADQKISDIGKNYKNLGAASALFDKVNRERVKAGKQEMPITVFMRTLDTGVGSNNFGDGWNDIDDAAITEALRSAGKMYDTALAGKDYYERLSALVDGGARPEQMDIDRGWNRLYNQPEGQPQGGKQKKADVVRAEIARDPGMVYDPYLGRYIPKGSFTAHNPAPPEAPRKLKVSTRPPVTLTSSGLKLPSY